MKLYRVLGVLVLFVMMAGRPALALENVGWYSEHVVDPGGGDPWPTFGTLDVWQNDSDHTYYVTGGLSPLAPPPLPPLFPMGWSHVSSHSFTDDHFPLLPYLPPLGSNDPSGRIYLTWDSSATLASGDVDITVMLGIKDSSYAGDSGLLTGFDPAYDPGFTSGGGFLAPSGDTFAWGSHSVLNVSELALSFPQYDMSDWVGGGQAEVFTTTVPLGALVPEPSSLALAWFGAGLLMRRRRRGNMSEREKEREKGTSLIIWGLARAAGAA